MARRQLAHGRRIGRGRLAASGVATALQIARHGARAMEVPKEAARRLGAILGDSGGMVADWHGPTVADASGGIDGQRWRLAESAEKDGFKRGACAW